MTFSPIESLVSSAENDPFQLSLQQEAVQVVAGCMLAREIIATHHLEASESAFMQQILLDPESTKPKLLQAIQTHGSASNARAVERSAAALRSQGLIETVQLWRAAKYLPAEAVVVAAKEAIETRAEAVAEARALLLYGLELRLHNAVDDSRSQVAQNEPHHFALERLCENLGWPVSCAVLTRPTDKANNLQRVLKEIEAVLPEGTLLRVGDKNKTKYMLDIEKIITLGKEQVVAPEIVSIDIDRLSALRLALYIRSERALMLLDLLEKNGGELSRKRINELFALADSSVPKEKMYLALKSLRKHGLVLTHDDDETVPKHSIRLKPDFNLDDYEEKGTVRLQNREKRQKQRKVLTREERLARRREQEALKRQVLRNSPERIRANEARIKARIDAKNEILRLREERRAISAEAKKLAMEARQQRLAERQAEVEQRARDVQERRQQLVTQKANKVAREARVREIDTTNGIYPNMRRKPALTNEIVIEIRTSNPTLVETISAHFHSDPTPLYSEDIAEIAADFGIPVTDVLETLCSAKTASDLPLFRVEDSRVVLAPFALRGKRLLTFQQALA